MRIKVIRSPNPPRQIFTPTLPYIIPEVDRIMAKTSDRTPISIDDLAFEFFRVFSRCEFSLKTCGFYDRRRGYPAADWSRFAHAVSHIFDEPISGAFITAIKYYEDHPPQTQVVEDGRLRYRHRPVDGIRAYRVLRYVCIVRNNLFHGAKFNVTWFDPPRSRRLLRHGLTILRVAIDSLPETHRAFHDYVPIEHD